jgi:hypothetical protein
MQRFAAIRFYSDMKNFANRDAAAAPLLQPPTVSILAQLQ